MTNKQPPPWKALIGVLQPQTAKGIASLDGLEELSPPADHSLIVNHSSVCQACRENLPLFVNDELIGDNVDELYPALAQHLDQCAACLAAYMDLAQLTYQAWLAGGDQ